MCIYRVDSELLNDYLKLIANVSHDADLASKLYTPSEFVSEPESIQNAKKNSRDGNHISVVSLQSAEEIPERASRSKYLTDHAAYLVAGLAAEQSSSAAGRYWLVVLMTRSRHDCCRSNSWVVAEDRVWGGRPRTVTHWGRRLRRRRGEGRQSAGRG